MIRSKSSDNDEEDENGGGVNSNAISSSPPHQHASGLTFLYFFLNLILRNYLDISSEFC